MHSCLGERIAPSEAAHQGDQLFKMLRCLFLTSRCSFIKQVDTTGCFWKLLIKWKKASWAETWIFFICPSCCFWTKNQHLRMPVGHTAAHLMASSFRAHSAPPPLFSPPPHLPTTQLDGAFLSGIDYFGHRVKPVSPRTGFIGSGTLAKARL